MRKTMKWMLLLAATLFVGKADATDAKGFSGKTFASGNFEEFDLFNHWFLTGVPREERHRRFLWLSHLRTRGASDLFVQDNTWAPGGTTGWHTHPGASLIIVTLGTVTVYEGDDLGCTPHAYTAGQTFVDAGGSHVHVIRNETSSPAKTVAVQLVPHAVARRIGADAPGNCPF